MSTSVLDDVLARIARGPHAAAALVLYALMSTLEQERAGCLFKLTKLRDLDAGDRQLAYRLIELMAEGGNRGLAWQEARMRAENMIRRGQAGEGPPPGKGAGSVEPGRKPG